MARTTLLMFYRKIISSGGEVNSMQKQERSDEIAISRITDEVQETESQEDKILRPMKT
jgi:hypothetical protein